MPNRHLFAQPAGRSWGLLSRRIDSDPLLPEDYVAFTRGKGTYHARLVLKSLSGYWRPDLLGGVWLVPERNADAAEEAIELARVTGQELPADLHEGELLRCFMCGAEYPYQEFIRRKGARPAEWYCGCCEQTSLTRGQSKR